MLKTRWLCPVKSVTTNLFNKDSALGELLGIYGHRSFLLFFYAFLIYSNSFPEKKDRREEVSGQPR